MRALYFSSDCHLALQKSKTTIMHKNYVRLEGSVLVVCNGHVHDVVSGFSCVVCIGVIVGVAGGGGLTGSGSTRL